MKQLLVLCWGLLALATGTPVSLPGRALEMALDEFHNKSHIQFSFQQQNLVESVETLARGTFVQLEVDLVQTLCRKSQRGTQNCRIKPGGRKQTCLACFKFDSSGESVLDKLVWCLSQRATVLQEVKRKQAQECEEVKQAGEERYRPGVFAFIKAPRGV